jgi:hypothetical protein
VQIGACYFDRVTGEIGDTFATNIEAAGNGDIDADTVYWWLEQSDAARQSILAQPRVQMWRALQELNAFLRNAKFIWSHATFDFVIIMEAFRRQQLKPSFSYRSARDIRTLVDLAGVDTKAKPRDGVHHNGLDDAKYQVAYCVEAFRALRRGAQ